MDNTLFPSKDGWHFSRYTAFSTVHPSSPFPESFPLVSPKPVDADHDPSRYDLFPTDTLKIGGKFFKTYSTVSGLGAPIAVVGRTESPHFRQQYKLRRIYAPITAIVRFSGRKAHLEFIDPLSAEGSR